MHQRRRDVGFLNRRMNVLGTTAANAINEVRVVVTRAHTVWPWFGLIRKPSLVRVVSIDGEVAARSVESVANGVGLCVFWPQGLCALRLFVWSGAESRGGHSTGPVSTGAYLRLVIGDPVADFEFHHFALAVRIIEIEGCIQDIGCLLIVLEHKVSAHGGHTYREANPQAPPSDIDFVDGLVADFAVPGVPDPMPVVVKAIARKRLQRCGAGPQVIIDAGRNGFRRGVPNRRPPLVANRAGHVDIADRAVTQMLDGFQHAGVRSRLAAVLANSVVLLYRPDQLASFKGVVRARLFDVDVFPGLAGPDGHERVPMIGRGDGDGVNVFVLKELANIDVRFWLWQTPLLDLAETLVRHVLIHIAQSGKLCSRDPRKPEDVIISAAAYSADGHPDAIICAEDLAIERKRSCAHRYCFSRRFKKFTPLDCHNCRLCVGNIP